VTAAGGIGDLAARARRGERLGFDDGVRLFRHPVLLELAELADGARRRIVPGDTVTYVVGRNVNYTNVCWVRCRFCAFYRPPGDPEGYLHPTGKLLEKIGELTAIGGSEVLMQGGLNPELKIDYYEGLLRAIREAHDVHLHAFSPTEIRYIARLSDLSLEETLGRLRDAGLDSVPGGGAEMLVEEVRRRLAPLKETWEEWLEVMEVANRMGITTTATMMYGTLETVEHRVQHLLRVREAQDRGGGFTAFIPWSFQGPAPELDAPRASALDYLRTVAVSRLLLDNVPHLQASWVTQGAKVAQIGLGYGLDDMGSVMMEENVVSAAGTTYRVDVPELRRLIEEAGCRPAQRDTYYRPWEAGRPLEPSPARAAAGSG
jgi:cyclic dehypoxanthinyl futalosine synthase